MDFILKMMDFILTLMEFHTKNDEFHTQNDEFRLARLVHGRPYALQGNSYTNLFVHMKPDGDVSICFMRMMDYYMLMTLYDNNVIC